MEKSSISKLANSTFTSQFFPSEKTSQDQYLLPIKNNRVQLLHSILTPEMIHPKESNAKPLHLHAAFYNSPVSVLYLLRRGIGFNQADGDGKTVFHMCAYTGHDEVFKVVRNQMKLRRIRELNQEYIKLLSANNYKRTDAKSGKLKISVSEARQKVFDKMQQDLSALYEKYVFGLMLETFNSFMAVVKNTNRNCFHLGCLNRYQRCSNILQYMFKELSDIYLDLDGSALQLYNSVNGCFQSEGDKIDPRQFQDSLGLIEEMMLPARLQDVRKAMGAKVNEYVDRILQSKDQEGHSPLYLASKNGCTTIINLIHKWQSCTLKPNQSKEDLIKVANHNLARSHIMDLCEASKEADSKKMNFLLSCGEQINKKKTIFGTFALLEAVKSFSTQKNLQPIHILILSGANVNQQDTNGWTVLHHACQRGQVQVIRQIFKIWESGKSNKISINKLTNKNYHCLHLAAMNNHPEVIEYLLTNTTAKRLQLNVDCVDGDRCTMLHHAARKGCVQALRKILQLAPGLLTFEDIRSNTALHYAAMGDYVACIQYLLYFDSDFDKLQFVKNTKGKLAKDMTVNKKQFENVFTAARLGDVNLVRKIISQNVAVRKVTTPVKERSLLIIGVLNQHLLLVKFLMEQGADLQHKDKSGRTAKDYAIQFEKKAKGKQELVVAKNICALLAY